MILTIFDILIAMKVSVFKFISKCKILLKSPLSNHAFCRIPTVQNCLPFEALSRAKSCSSSNNELSFGKYKFHPEVESQINKQINHEQDASQMYLAIAGYFGNVNIARRGCYHFFIEMHKEETQHAGSLIKYQLLRGGQVLVNKIEAPCLQDTTVLQYFEKALQMELDITAKLEHLINLAEKHKDYHCADYITAEFMKEQINSINMLANLITNIKNLGNNEINMYIFDLTLEKKYSKSIL